jgi:hypothetical protein
MSFLFAGGLRGAVKGASIGCFISLMLSLAAAGGCTRTAPTGKAGSTASRSASGMGAAEDTMRDARETLYEPADLAACRNAVRQLNGHLTHHPARKPADLTSEERAFLSGSDGYELDDDEVKEVANPTFTPLDAAYFDCCFLFRDVVRGLQGDQRARAVAVFDWAIRQVRLRERPDEPDPPQYIARRGWGTSYERAMIVLAAMQQAEVDGCLIAVPQQPAGAASKGRVALVGALVGGDILVFDTRMGMGLPGPGGKGIATLAQLCNDPSVLQQLTVDPKAPYDLTPQQMKSAEIRVAAPLSALAPRMRYLQHELAANKNHVVLAMDGRALLDRFKKAAAGQNISVRVGDDRGDTSTPTRLLRSFLPPDEGGTDEPRMLRLAALGGFVAPQDNRSTKIGRKKLFTLELTPWYVLPPPIRELEYSSDPGARLREMYAEFFANFPVPAVPSSAMERLNGGIAIPAEEQDMSQRIGYHFLGKQSLKEPTHFSLLAKSARDDMLRNRLDEAAKSLQATIDQARFQQSLTSRPDLGEKVARWCERAWNVYAKLARLERQAAAKGPAGLEELQQARTEAALVWGESDGAVLPVWLMGLAGAAAIPMHHEASYLLALCKQEWAERTKDPQDWGSAVDLWEAYLSEDSAAPPAVAARALQARALEKIGERAKARAVLEDLQGPISEIDKVGRLYRAKHLQDAPAAAPGSGR